MLKAYDQTIRSNVFADKGDKSHVYVCPECEAKLKYVPRSERCRAYFAHIASAQLTERQRACIIEANDHSPNDLSEWKIRWTKVFPEECLERLVCLNNKWKRADVRFDGNKTVVHIQHTVLRKDEFVKRNAFFLEAGYRNVWLIDGNEFTRKGWLRSIPLKDLSEQQQKISREKGQYHFNFSKYEEIFGEYDPKTDKNVIVFITRQVPKKEAEYLYKIDWVPARTYKERFSAVYTPVSSFLSVCKNGTNYNNNNYNNK